MVCHFITEKVVPFSESTILCCTTGNFLVIENGSTATLLHPDSLAPYKTIEKYSNVVECDGKYLYCSSSNHNSYFFMSTFEIESGECLDGEIMIHDSLFLNMFVYKDEFVGLRMKDWNQTDSYVVQKEKRNRYDRFEKMLDVEDVPADAGISKGIYKDYLLFYNKETNRICAIHLRQPINCIEYWTIEVEGEETIREWEDFTYNGSHAFFLCFVASFKYVFFATTFDIARKKVILTPISTDLSPDVLENICIPFKNVGSTLFVQGENCVYKLKPKVIPIAPASKYQDITIAFK